MMRIKQNDREIFDKDEDCNYHDYGWTELRKSSAELCHAAAVEKSGCRGRYDSKKN